MLHLCVHVHKFLQVTTNCHIWNPSYLKRSSIESPSYLSQADFSKMSSLKQDFRTIISWKDDCNINLLKPTGHVIHQQFNILQLYVLPTLYLCVLYLSESKQRLVPLTV